MNEFNNCTFNFNGATAYISRTILAGVMYKRQLMAIQHGNKAVIDSISGRELGVVFETDELKERILHSDENPAKKAFLVDVVVLTCGGKPAAYKVMALHDVVGLEDI